MIPAYKKRNFVNQLIVKGYISNDLSKNFFFDMIKKEELTDKLIFTSTFDPNKKYSMTLNISTKIITLRINGKFYRGLTMLKYVLKALTLSNEKIFVYVNTSGSPRLNKQYNEVLWDYDMVKDLISECAVELVLSDVKKKQYVNLIDIALDNKDKEEFTKLINEYKTEFRI